MKFYLELFILLLQKSGSMRASSAIHDKEPRIAYRERSFTSGTNLSNAQTDRPSTTHAVYRVCMIRQKLR